MEGRMERRMREVRLFTSDMRYVCNAYVAKDLPEVPRVVYYGMRCFLLQVDSEYDEIPTYSECIWTVAFVVGVDPALAAAENPVNPRFN